MSKLREFSVVYRSQMILDTVSIIVIISTFAQHTLCNIYNIKLSLNIDETEFTRVFYSSVVGQNLGKPV